MLYFRTCSQYTDSSQRSPGANERASAAIQDMLKNSNLTGISSKNKLPNVQFHDRIALLDLIKSCGNTKSINKAKRIHADLLKKDLIATDAYIGTALITAYAKCAAVEEAREVFDQLPVQDVVSWSALIAVYGQNGFFEEALKCFRQMQKMGVSPDGIAYLCILKACGVMGSLEIGKDIDADIRKQGLLQKDVKLGNALVDMYCKCGELERAREVFGHLPVKDVVSWTVLIAGYVHQRLGDEALRCFEKMLGAGVCPDAVTYVSVLTACGIARSLEVGRNIDSEVRKRGLLEKNDNLGTALIDMYCKCGVMERAEEVFEKLLVQDVVTWSALIAGYAQNRFGNKALNCFHQMQDLGIRPNAATYISVLKVCGMVRCLEIGEVIHAEVKREGLLEKDLALGNGLIDMYSKCGSMEKAKEVFMQLSRHNDTAWSTLITGFVQNGFYDEALICFRNMLDAGVIPNSVVYICILKVFGVMGSLEIGKAIDAEVRKKGLLENDVMLGNALVDMYSKCGELKKAREVINQLPVKNALSWGALIAGYAEHGLLDDARECFSHMQKLGVRPDAVTYVFILRFCGILGSQAVGEEIDAEMRKQDLLHNDIVLATALMDMYVKCAALEKAQEVFQQLPLQNVVSWSVLIAGYSQSGQANVALNLYKRMREDSVLPDSATFVILLTACSHAGLLEEGETLFDEMCVDYCISPTLEHYTCMIDLFGRAGHFEKAQAWLYKAPPCGHIPLLTSILGSCVKWNNVLLGRWAFEQLLQLDQKYVTAYICMENIYKAAGMPTQADKIEALRIKNNAVKMPEWWWIDADRDYIHLL